VVVVVVVVVVREDSDVGGEGYRQLFWCCVVLGCVVWCCVVFVCTVPYGTVLRMGGAVSLEIRGVGLTGMWPRWRFDGGD
jgi:hypothetical protein